MWRKVIMPEIDLIRIPRPVIDNIPPPVASGIEPPSGGRSSGTSGWCPWCQYWLPNHWRPNRTGLQGWLVPTPDSSCWGGGHRVQRATRIRGTQPNHWCGWHWGSSSQARGGCDCWNICCGCHHSLIVCRCGIPTVETVLTPMAKEMMKPKKKGKKAKIKQKKPVLHFVEDEKGVVEIFQYSEKGVKVLGPWRGSWRLTWETRLRWTLTMNLRTRSLWMMFSRNSSQKKGWKGSKPLFTPKQSYS